VGDGTTPSGVAVGEEAGAVGAVSGVAVGVVWASGVEAGAGEFRGDGVVSGVGVPGGDAAVSGVEAGVAVGTGDGEFADCPLGDPDGRCSHPTTRRLATATGTTRRLHMPINTDAQAGRIFKVGYKRVNFEQFARSDASTPRIFTATDRIGLES
jgi:hypothetical protein